MMCQYGLFFFFFIVQRTQFDRLNNAIRITFKSNQNNYRDKTNSIIIVLSSTYLHMAAGQYRRHRVCGFGRLF